MKRKLMAIALAAACVTLTACDNGNGSGSEGSSVVSNAAASPAEKTSALLDEVTFPEMRKLETSDDLKAILGLDEADITEYSAYICPSGMSPDEFGVFVAKDEATAEKIKTLLESRIKYQSDTFKDYPLAAAEVYKLEDAFADAEGSVVYYAICADNTKARDILG